MSHESPLGKATSYGTQYDPELLFAIPRAASRARLGLGVKLPFTGVDIWTAWELTWLNAAGVPQVAVAEIRVPFDSPRLIESKSLKLYLGSFAMARIGGTGKLQQMIETDLDSCTGSNVELRLHDAGKETNIEEFPGDCIDSVETACDVFDVDAGLLAAGSATVSESLHSHLLRSLCPVTDQPDMGSVLISYEGPRIDRAGLLRYIVSYREHNDFHEACVERMFIDIRSRCRPTKLSVLARYQRRGGIDINPFRSNYEPDPQNLRLWRQ